MPNVSLQHHDVTLQLPNVTSQRHDVKPQCLNVTLQCLDASQQCHDVRRHCRFVTLQCHDVNSQNRPTFRSEVYPPQAWFTRHLFWRIFLQKRLFGGIATFLKLPCLFFCKS
jgi:hypothetical protein